MRLQKKQLLWFGSQNLKQIVAGIFVRKLIIFILVRTQREGFVFWFWMLSLLRLNRSSRQLRRSSATVSNALRPKHAPQSVYSICKIYRRNVQSFSFVQAYDQGLPNSTFINKSAESVGLFGMKGNDS